MDNDTLFAAAVELKPELSELSPRQFNARYPLRVRRWELSERTRLLKPKGALSDAAARAAADAHRPQPPAPLSGTGPATPAHPAMDQDGSNGARGSKREAARRRGRRAAGLDPRAGDRVRQALLRFATAIAAAGSPAAVIEVVMTTEEYVEEMLNAVADR